VTSLDKKLVDRIHLYDKMQVNFSFKPQMNYSMISSKRPPELTVKDVDNQIRQKFYAAMAVIENPKRDID